MLALLLYLVAVLLFTLAAIGVRTARVNLGWAAVAAFTYGVLPEL